MAKPTVHDIARAASVSLATVDRVLNDRPGVRVVTAERVRAAIKKLGYVRDVSAANLARQRTYRFVFILPDGDSQFHVALRQAVTEASKGIAMGEVADSFVDHFATVFDCEATHQEVPGKAATR